jgi:hypothetical protein
MGSLSFGVPTEVEMILEVQEGRPSRDARAQAVTGAAVVAAALPA